MLVGAFALAAVVWQRSTAARTPITVLSAAVTKGAVITDADLRPAPVALDRGMRAVAWTQRHRLVGKVALVDLPVGTVLASSLVTDNAALAPGESLVGLKLAPGAYPSDLRAGDHLAVVRTADAQAPSAAGDAVLASDASVWSVTPLGDQGGARLVTVRLPEAEGAVVSAVADHVHVVRVVR